MRANVGMKNLIWKCLCWAQLFLNATFGQFVYMTGRHVCTQEKKESQMQPFQKTFCVPEFQTFLRPCRSGEQQSLCTGYRTMYKTVTHTVYKRAEVAKIEYVCCPGWARENIKPGCTKAVCKDECKNNGSCVQPGICKCEPGWTGSSCEQDVNECLIKNGGCQHDCLNEAGSHQCRCNEGFMLKEDGKTCDRSSSSQINLPLANHDEEIHVNSPSEKQRDPETDDALNIAASSTLRLQLKDLNLRMEALEEIMVKLSRVIQSAPLEEDPLAIPDGEQNQKTVSGILRKMSEATYLGEVRAPVLQTGSVPAQGEHSLQGTAGPCPKGDSGPPGPKGDTGERGEKGERGLKGEKGDAGDAVAPWSRLPSLDVFGTLVEKVAALESQLEQCGCYSDVRIDVSKHPRDAPNMKGLTEAPRSKVQN